MPSEEALKKWKVVELKAELVKLGLESKGKKRVLFERLTAAREAAKAVEPVEEAESGARMSPNGESLSGVTTSQNPSSTASQSTRVQPATLTAFCDNITAAACLGLPAATGPRCVATAAQRKGAG